MNLIRVIHLLVQTQRLVWFDFYSYFPPLQGSLPSRCELEITLWYQDTFPWATGGWWIVMLPFEVTLMLLFGFPVNASTLSVYGAGPETCTRRGTALKRSWGDNHTVRECFSLCLINFLQFWKVLTNCMVDDGVFLTSPVCVTRLVDPGVRVLSYSTFCAV